MNVKQLHKTAIVQVAGLAMALLACMTLISGCSRGFANANRVVSAQDGQLTITEANGLARKTHKVAPDAEVTLDGQPAALEELDSGDAVKLTTEKTEDGAEVVRKIEAKSKEAVEAEEAEPNSLINPPVTPFGPPVDEPLSDTTDNSAVPSDLAPITSESATDQPLIDPEDRAPEQADKSDSVYGDYSDAAVVDESFSGKISSLGDNQFVIKDDSDDELTFMVNDETKYTLDGNEATFDQLMVDHTVGVTAKMNGDIHVATTVDATNDE